MHHSIGIVLRVDLLNKTIIIFDRDLGKFKTFLFSCKNLVKINNINLCNGAFVNYIVKDTYRIKVENFNIIDVPFNIARKNIDFFHHILELCYYFIPLNMTSSEIFDLIYFALFSFDKLESLKSQKVLITKFFLLLGFYLEENEDMKSFFNYIITIPIDRIANEAIDLKKEKELSLWILKCINMHPYSKLFKTNYFLNKIVV